MSEKAKNMKNKKNHQDYTLVKTSHLHYFGSHIWRIVDIFTLFVVYLTQIKKFTLLEKQNLQKCNGGSLLALIWTNFVTAVILNYYKFPKYSDTQKIWCNHSKIWTVWIYHRVMSLNDVDGKANSVDPDQTVWSGSALFAQAYLCENLASLW